MVCLKSNSLVSSKSPKVSKKKFNPKKRLMGREFYKMGPALSRKSSRSMSSSKMSLTTQTHKSKKHSWKTGRFLNLIAKVLLLNLGLMTLLRSLKGNHQIFFWFSSH